MESEFASAKLTIGQVNAIVKRLGGYEGALRFLRGETEIKEKWREENGIINFSVTSNGRTGKEWIAHLRRKGYGPLGVTESVLCSPDFRPTNGVTTHIAVLKGNLWGDEDRSIDKIRAFASERNLTVPNMEVACLIRDMFSCKKIKAMGINWILTMHDPIKDIDGVPRILIVSGKTPWLEMEICDPKSRWVNNGGFAFVLSQVSGF